MPIRIEPDSPKDPRRNQPRDPRRQDGGGGGLGKLLPFILLFVFKKPKLLIPILLVGAVWYFFFGGSAMFSGGDSQDYQGEDIQFSFGASFDQEKYDATEVFEPLSYGSNQNQMPSSFSLLQYAPPRRHQGRQGSCVGWASAYAARTILEARATGKSANSTAFSPSFLYNQIALPNCQGAYMKDAMQSMHRNGSIPFSQFAYNERTCSTNPGRNLLQQAQNYRIKGYNRLTLGGNNYRPDMQAIKQHLAQGAPVVIGMQVGGTFMSRMVAQDVWRPTQRDYGLRGFSGHAMCVIGYDDRKAGGAFQIMNSWGERWGNRGVAWVSYKDFDYFVKEAYGIYPMGKSPKYAPNKLAVKFGLVDNNSQSLIRLAQTDSRNNVFRTRSPIRKGDRFKVAITNSIECYIYVFGEETDGSSYVLFPYTRKHSPYCGITGTRVFPREESLVADNLGNKDRIAIVVSKKEIDYDRVNQMINNSRQRTYAAKLKEVLGSEQIPNVNFEAGEAIEFITDTKGKNVVGVVLEIDKR